MLVEELVLKYLASNAFNKLSENSKINYRTTLKRSLKDGLGSKTVEEVNFTFTDQWYEEAVAKRGPSAAYFAIAVFKKIWNWGYRREYTTVNPWLKMELETPEAREVTWTKEQVEQFIQTANKYDKDWLALLVIMCYYLSQRPSDILALRWEHYKDGWLTIYQSKTSQVVSLPVPKQLKAILETDTHKYKYIICKDTRVGDYVNYNTAARQFKRIRKLAGLPENLTMRDLRRTGLTELGEYGLTEDQIRAISGHKTRDTLNVYVRIRDKIAEEAMKKRFGDDTGNIFDDPYYNDGQLDLEFNKPIRRK